ncbi:hypothetical protein DAPK24_010800 [Pichia kluyveri]|uniref:Uncharacterized protein n=1 Tax=Pichia kluyveri TaxID=36015 RepID=A0AAV5QZP3_PICKL|nr:hypothetical protein DAPK24_010800 [Pichia kluyveri]
MTMDISFEDTTLRDELLTKLLTLRESNRQYKEKLWESVSALSDVSSNAKEAPQSVSYEESLTNEQLKSLLHESRKYNNKLMETIEEYEDSLQTILNALVEANISATTSVIDSIDVKDNSSEQEMWDSWFDLVNVLNGIIKPSSHDID